ncbi:uncharacterized protein BYT42DRAFT_493944 [Radiomyces spectabilis]|uniref:uncharacterized protein n=1 Tax=Radiomyces spectabilis TaxID=64574 RepID=UPI00221F8841|nr:uncharacterized protein BYT42DRAFT_493944 [Radiomyces spectabilis]KAI8384942.1 hypothetical protein BYT42DRAFT_493944 [Radiomyces spectabilis]
MSAIETARSEPLPRIAVQTITIRIYIDDAKNHKTVQLTNLLTAAMVIQYLKKKALIDASDEWTLFEIANSHGVERPIRSWEIVLDVISAWESDAANALLAILHKRTSAAHGWVYIEYKKGKWQKRFCFIKDNAIYHAKDNKGSSSAILCYLATFDVYTLLQPLHAAPAPFVFALRAQEKFSMFEREHDYLRLLAVDDQEAMKEWVLSIRAAKVIFFVCFWLVNKEFST